MGALGLDRRSVGDERARSPDRGRLRGRWTARARLQRDGSKVGADVYRGVRSQADPVDARGGDPAPALAHRRAASAG